MFEVAFSDNLELDLAVTRNGAIAAAYATRDPQPATPFWPRLFDNLTIRLLRSDGFPAEAKQQPAAELTAAAAAGDFVIPVAEPFPLGAVALAHDQVDADNRRRVLLAVG